jgi:DNA-binding MarR family transcriptional regulator
MAAPDPLADAGRQLGAQTIAFGNAVAERLGINRTDYECLDLLDAHGPMPAGRLAELTGLTSGAITGVIDRLERARLARRSSDPRDRRRVLVELIDDRNAELDEIFGPYSERWLELAAQFTPADLEVVARWSAKAAALLQSETRRVRERSAGGPPPPVS